MAQRVLVGAVSGLVAAACLTLMLPTTVGAVGLPDLARAEAVEPVYPEPFMFSSAVAAKTARSTGSLSLVISGERLGQNARIRLVGVKGSAKGTHKTIRVANRRMVRLKTGTYLVAAKPLSQAEQTAVATVAPKRAVLRAGKRTRVSVRYQLTIEPPDSSDPPSPPGSSTSPGILLSSLTLSATQARPGEVIQASGTCHGVRVRPWAVQVDGYFEPSLVSSGWDLSVQTGLVSDAGQWGPMNVTIPAASPVGKQLTIFAVCFATDSDPQVGGPHERVVTIL